MTGRELDLFSQAQSAFAQRDYTQALRLSDSLEATGRKLVDSDFLRGRILFQLNQLDSAEVAYDDVVDLEPSYDGVWHNLGNISFQKRQYRLALNRYQKEVSNQAAARPWHAIGGTYEALGIADSAHIAYSNAISEDSTYAPAHANLADWYEREGLFELALSSAERALRNDPANLDLMQKVGILQSRTGNHEDALATLQEVIRDQPWNYSALFAMGRSLQSLGITEEAQIVLERADSVREEQSSIDLLAGAARSRPTSFQHQLELAIALRKSGRLDDAIEAYLIASNLRPNNLALLNNIATLFLESGDAEEAIRRYHSIVETDSTFGLSWINLGAYYSRTGQNELAKHAWDQALIYAPDHPVVKSVRSRMDAAE